MGTTVTPEYVRDMLRRVATLTGKDTSVEALARAGIDLALEITGHTSAALIGVGHASRPECLLNHKVSPAYMEAVIKSYVRLPGAQSVGGGYALVVPDVTLSPSYEGFREAQRAANVRALAIFPIRVGMVGVGDAVIEPGQPIAAEFAGALCLYHSEPLDVDPARAAMISVLAQNLGLGVSVARLLSERAQLRREAVLEKGQEVVATLTAGAAHDFNNVLNALLGMTTLLPEYGRDEQAAALRRVREQVLEAAHLTRVMLDLSRLKRPDEGADRCELGGQLQNAVDMMRLAAHPSHRIELQLPATTCWTTISSASFSRIILNLMINAEQAMEKMPDGVIRISVREEPGAWLVTVDDNGRGVPVEHRDSIFQPFVSVGKKGGSGVGLAAARGLAEQAGGGLFLQNREGPGACFVVRLPSCAPDVGVEEVKVEGPGTTVGAAPGAGARVLLAEDDDLQRDMYARALAGAGFVVRAVADGWSALSALHEGSFVAAVLDQRMPGKTGMDVLAEVRAQGLRLPVVMVSGLGIDHHAINPDPNTRVVGKPLPGDSLVALVREVVEAGRAPARTRTG